MHQTTAISVIIVLIINVKLFLRNPSHHGHIYICEGISVKLIQLRLKSLYQNISLLQTTPTPLVCYSRPDHPTLLVCYSTPDHAHSVSMLLYSRPRQLRSYATLLQTTPTPLVCYSTSDHAHSVSILLYTRPHPLR